MQKGSAVSLRLNCCPCRTHRNANHYLSPAAGWRLPEELALGWRVFLTLEMAPEALPLFVSASGFHPAGLSLKLKDVSNYKPRRGRLGAGSLRGFSRAEGTAEGVGSRARTPPCPWDATFVPVRAALPHICPPVPQSPPQTLCLRGLGKQTEEQSGKKVILLPKKQL